MRPECLPVRRLQRVAQLRAHRGKSSGFFGKTMGSLSAAPFMFGSAKKDPAKLLDAAETLLAKDPTNVSALKLLAEAAGGLDLNGLRAEMTYFGDTLEKVGVEAEAVSAGRYKSAPRTFTADEPSPEEIEVENALLDGAYGALTGMIAKGRNLSVDDVKRIVDKGGLTSKDALDSEIVEEVAY